MRHFVHCLTGLSESTYHVRLILDPFLPFQLVLFNLGSFLSIYANARNVHLVGKNLFRYPSESWRQRASAIQAGGWRHGSDRRGWRASGHGSGSGDVLKPYREITYKSNRACLWQSSHTPTLFNRIHILIAYPLALCPTSICELESALSI